MYKQDLALSDIQWLICHKAQRANQLQLLLQHFFFFLHEFEIVKSYFLKGTFLK